MKKYWPLIGLLIGLSLIALGNYGESLRPWVAQVDRESMPPELHWYGIVEWIGWIVSLWCLFAGYHINNEKIQSNEQTKIPRPKANEASRSRI